MVAPASVFARPEECGPGSWYSATSVVDRNIRPRTEPSASERTSHVPSTAAIVVMIAGVLDPDGGRMNERRRRDGVSAADQLASGGPGQQPVGRPGVDDPVDRH